MLLLVVYIVLCLGLKTFAQIRTHDADTPIDFANLELDKKFLQGVRWAIEQQQKQDKIEVYHAIEIVDISRVNVNTMSVRIEIHLRQRWESKDLTLPPGLFKDEDPPDTFIRVYPEILNSLWSPDSFIPSARETKIAQFSNSQSIVNIFKNKSIVFKTRLHTVLGCAFNFQWYPLDKQTCDLTIESYTWPAEMVSYLWENLQTPVILTNFKLLQYEMALPLKYGNGSAPRWGRQGNYPYVLLRFSFERHIQDQMIQVFTPTTLIVVISWFSFWLGLDAVPGRISLLVTCLLALITMHTGLKGTIPPVNYVKMMDIWMVCCIAFVFIACLEFVVVKYLHWRKQQKVKAKEERDTAMAKYMTDHNIPQMKSSQLDSQKSPHMQGPLSFYKDMTTSRRLLVSDGDFPLDMMQQRNRNVDITKSGWQELHMNPALIPFDSFHPIQKQGFQSRQEWAFVPEKRPIWVTIDRVARIAFPIAFAVFNSAYWPVLFIGAANQE